VTDNDESQWMYPSLYEVAVAVADTIRARDESADLRVLSRGIIVFKGMHDITYRMDVSVMYPCVSPFSTPGKDMHLYTGTTGVSRVHLGLYDACPRSECSDLKLLTKESFR
jgi:hypothetical protein